MRSASGEDPSPASHPSTRHPEGTRPHPSHLVVREVWGEAPLEAVYEIRDEVFVDEQALTDDARTDPDDDRSFHYLALLDEQPVGIGRLTMFGREAQVAWVAVRQPYRQHGIGKAIMLAIIERAIIERASQVILNAQTHAIDFYTALGFEVVGGEFFMSGIGHQVMIKRMG